MIIWKCFINNFSEIFYQIYLRSFKNKNFNNTNSFKIFKEEMIKFKTCTQFAY